MEILSWGAMNPSLIENLVLEIKGGGARGDIFIFEKISISYLAHYSFLIKKNQTSRDSRARSIFLNHKGIHKAVEFQVGWYGAKLIPGSISTGS